MKVKAEMKRSSTQHVEVLKVDIDIPMPLFKQVEDAWTSTRRLMLEHLGFQVADIVIQPSQSGKVHAWIHITAPKPLTPLEKAKLQFLLGDDHNRSRLNFERAKRTPSKFDSFNILFSRKVKRGEGSG